MGPSDLWSATLHFLNEGGEPSLPLIRHPVVLCRVSHALERLLGIRWFSFWRGHVRAVLQIPSSAPLPHAPQASPHEPPVSLQAQLLLLHGSLIHSASWVPGFSPGLVTGISAWQTVGNCLLPQEVLMGLIRETESRYTDDSPIHTVSLRSPLAPVSEINSSSVLDFCDWESRGCK